MKKLLVLFVCILVAVLLAGCGETLTFEYVTDKTGGIHLNYVLTYDKDAPDANAVRSETTKVMEKIKERNPLATSNIVDEGDGKIALYVVYDTLADYYISRGITGNEKGQKANTENHVYYTTSRAEHDSYLTDENIDMVRSMLSAEYQSLPFVLDCYYVYGTPYKSIKTNADEVKEDEGIYYHRWKIENGKKMQVWQKVPNIVFYYGIGIGIFVVVTAVTFVVVIVKNKKKKRALALLEEKS